MEIYHVENPVVSGEGHWIIKGNKWEKGAPKEQENKINFIKR